MCYKHTKNLFSIIANIYVIVEVHLQKTVIVLNKRIVDPSSNPGKAICGSFPGNVLGKA